MKRFLKTLAPIAIVAVGAMGAFAIYMLRPEAETASPTPEAPLVRVARVESEPWQFIVRAQGTISPRSESSLISRVSGEVVWVSSALVSGGFFEAGETLLRVDAADYRVKVETAQAAVTRGESEHERAVKELVRQTRLSSRSVASEARFDDAINAEKVSAANLLEAGARLEQAERDLERTAIKAPYAGRVREKKVDVGEFVTPGRELGRVYAVDFAEVRLPIPDAELRFLDVSLGFESPDWVGPVVELSARFAGAEQTWSGRMVRIEGEIDAKSRMVHVVARVDDPYGRARDRAGFVPLAVGLFVEAGIQGRWVKAAVVVPRGALRENDRVLVVDAEERIRYRSVEVLRREHDQVVVGAGLEDGERICVSPIQAVVEGMQVRVAGDPVSVAPGSLAAGEVDGGAL